MSTQTLCFIGTVVTYFHVNISKKFVPVFSIRNKLWHLWKHSYPCKLKYLFLSASAIELVKSLPIDAERHCFIILCNFTFILHFVFVMKWFILTEVEKNFIYTTLWRHIRNMKAGVWRYIHCHTQTSLEIRSYIFVLSTHFWSAAEKNCSSAGNCISGGQSLPRDNCKCIIFVYLPSLWHWYTSWQYP